MSDDLIKRLRHADAPYAKPTALEILTDEAAALIEQQAARIAALEAQITTVAPAVDAQPVAWTKDLSKWLRGEAGRHMASIAPKGATITSHALQLKLWADQIDGYASAQLTVNSGDKR
jgi:hypothetical protein